MVLGLNWVDFVIIFTVAFFAIEAYGKRLLTELLDLVSFLLALILSFRYYNYLAQFIEGQFHAPHGFALVLGFMLTWFLTESLFFIAAHLILSRMKIKQYVIPGEKFWSILPAIFRSLIFLSLILVLIATFPIQPRIKKAVNESVLGNFILKRAYQLEQPVKQVFGGITEDTLTFLTIKPQTNESVNLGFQTSEFKIDEVDEKAMVDLVNKERESQGLNKLTFDSSLREVGRLHSSDMFKRGYFSHYSPEGNDVSDRAAEFDVDYTVIGENLAYAPSLETAHKGLMNSPGHRANILSPDYNKIGIGVMDGGIYGKMYTQVFSD